MKYITSNVLAISALLLALSKFSDASVTSFSKKILRTLTPEAIAVADVTVGYYASCGPNNILNEIVGDDHEGQLILAKSPAEVLVSPNCMPNSQVVCALKTDSIIWGHLSKLVKNVQEQKKLSVWETTYKYAYDAPPITYENGRRNIPVHLLKPGIYIAGALEDIKSKDHIVTIGDDGGARYINKPLFSSSCMPKVQYPPMSEWFDTTHATFKYASSLKNRNVIAIGDLHGDFDNAIATMQMAGLIDSHKKWIAVNTVFVQTGDLIDRGPDTKKVLDLMERLAKEAREHDSRVIQILGNHELMNLVHETKDAADSKEYHDPKKRAEAFKQTGELGKRLFRLPLVHRVGDTIFAHGGISKAWSKARLEQINAHAKNEIEHHEARKTILRQDMDSIIGFNGPAFFIEYSRNHDEKKVCDEVKAVLENYGVKRMVVAHAVQLNHKFLSRCDNTYIVIDIAISRWMPSHGNTIGALKILPDGRMEPMYKKQH